ncbi:unnamed protein product [Schistosoma margrebowiei]|uniref:DUF6451 domain-containing protein n=1 Tax=Schistosoma margrebowiei TaxID=48269 RepID=A0A3P8EDH5_9TREM|nr:unnamed protein product [Schistosoma margrebowiei]
MEDVKTFTYLGSIIDEHGGSDVDVEARIGKARAAYLQLRNIWNSKQLSTNTKIRIFNTNFKTVLLYGAETWGTTKTVIQKIRVFINSYLRKIPRIRLLRKDFAVLRRVLKAVSKFVKGIFVGIMLTKRLMYIRKTVLFTISRFFMNWISPSSKVKNGSRRRCGSNNNNNNYNNNKGTSNNNNNSNNNINAINISRFSINIHLIVNIFITELAIIDLFKFKPNKVITSVHSFDAHTKRTITCMYNFKVFIEFLCLTIVWNSVIAVPLIFQSETPEGKTYPTVNTTAQMNNSNYTISSNEYNETVTTTVNSIEGTGGVVEIQTVYLHGPRPIINLCLFLNWLILKINKQIVVSQLLHNINEPFIKFHQLY